VPIKARCRTSTDGHLSHITRRRTPAPLPGGSDFLLLIKCGAWRRRSGPVPTQPQALARGVRPGGRSPRDAQLRNEEPLVSLRSA
jgi:hypothetical protein